MICLGIESTAHTFGVGIADDDGVLANATSAYEPDEGGIHPREAAEHHYSHALETVHNALGEAGLETEDIDCIAFARGPGMPQSLQVGAVTARSLAIAHDLPLYPVNHVSGHIEIGRHATCAGDPIVLYVSGGNTQIIAFTDGRYRVVGETLDIAIGNAIDKLARTLGIPHPGGPRVEELAQGGEELHELSYVVKGMDISFAGMVTEAQRLHNEGVGNANLCFSFQEHAYAMLVEATERAMAHFGKETALLTGGVAANQRLQGMLETMCEDRGAEAFCVPIEYATDNGAMIAWQGINRAQTGGPTPPADTAVRPDWRVGEVDVTWR